METANHGESAQRRQSAQPLDLEGLDDLSREVGILAGRLAALLRSRFSAAPAQVEPALGFLDHSYSAVAGERTLESWQGSLLERLVDARHPLGNLARGFSLNDIELELILLAGMAEEHEGYADIFRTLHPSGQPRPTLGLAAQLICGGSSLRLALRRILVTGNAVRKGVLHCAGDGPFFARDLKLADQLWPVLHGIDSWPGALAVSRPAAVFDGLDAWLQSDEVRRTQAALSRGARCTVFVSADRVDTAWHRSVALAARAGISHVALEWPGRDRDDWEDLLQVHAMARRTLPLIKLTPPREGEQRPEFPTFADFRGPIVVCSETGLGASGNRRPVISLRIERLGAASLRDMWRQSLPGFADHAHLLAARYPLEPLHAVEVAADLAFIETQCGRAPELGDVLESIRARSTTVLDGGVAQIRPQASWDQLVLPAHQRSQLEAAVQRIYLQPQVLDDWQFLRGRRGARGVRMLFAGPPGTGKTLSAEVLANELGVDLLVVDLSRVVSKWIGETEKNLARVFATAERARAVLLFDEADALFGKRTEVSDAHDRYANLETAYLLARLEQYDGLAILATNLRQNIDAAFTRRLEFIVEFDEPGRAERAALWRCHIPDGVPLAGDVRVEELAAQFPIVGGLIRNAAVAAAFLAAEAGEPIAREHFIQAVRREYEKSGKPFRELSAPRVQQE